MATAIPFFAGLFGTPRAGSSVETSGGFFDRLRNGFEDNPNALGALGMGLLAHRQNAVANPLGDVAQNFMYGGQIDSKERLAKQEEAHKEAQRNATADFLVSKGLAKDYDTAKALPVAVQEELIKSVFKEPEKPSEPWTISDGYRMNKQTGEYEPLSGGMPKPEDLLKAEVELRKEFTGRPEVKRFDDVHSSFKRVRQSAALGTGPGDMGVIFGYMKMLDPTSAVREGEYANAQNSAGIPERIRSLYNSIKNGEKLTADQRREFVRAAESLYTQEASGVRSLEGQYNTLATGAQVDPNRVTILDIPEYQTIPLPDLEAEMKRRGILTPNAAGAM